jgi:hypothetical protein
MMPRRARVGKQMSEPLNETRVRFKSGGRKEIYKSDETYLGQIGKIK